MISIQIRKKLFPARGQAPDKLLFKDFSLDVAEGEVIAILGASGIGKSSLLNILAGIDDEYDGILEGRPEPIGYLFQAPRLLPWRTALENVQLAIPEQLEQAVEWLQRVGLSGAENVYPSQLSLGMARRVALARTLAVRPRLLLLDEPFASLDEETGRDMQTLIAAYMQMARPTTFLVTHDWSEATSLADRVIVLESSPVQIVKDHAVARARAAE